MGAHVLILIKKCQKKKKRAQQCHVSSGDQMLAIDPTIAWAQLSSLLLHAPAGNRTRVCTVAGYYSTTRPLCPTPGLESFTVTARRGVSSFLVVTALPSPLEEDKEFAPSESLFNIMLPAKRVLASEL
uniref:Uncharacterized protein n=1 Tax=Salix viminalis TaxID=40686 RepID=A0A6N2N5D6_SALVM